ncbi:hypothetical protein BGZ49_006590 [Haplosporangium sp. Z 27]|nr:hypothetical protein BGZ49_006590 [Haplosporangium sp. Z 27]
MRFPHIWSFSYVGEDLLKRSCFDLALICKIHTQALQPTAINIKVYLESFLFENIDYANIHNRGDFRSLVTLNNIKAMARASTYNTVMGETATPWAFQMQLHSNSPAS